MYGNIYKNNLLNPNMQKNLVITCVLGLILISFASAYGSYNSFSFGELFDSIDSSTMLLGSLFLIFFAIIYFATSRVFKDRSGYPNKGVASTISIVTSLLIVYGIHQTGFEVEELFYNIGVSEGMLNTLVPIILLIGAIYLIYRFKFKGFFLTFGALFIGLSFTDLIYAKGLLASIGAAFILIGLFLLRRAKKKEQGGVDREPPRQSRDPGFIRRKWGARKDKKKNRAKLQGDLGDLTSQMRRINKSIRNHRARLRRLPPGSPQATAMQTAILQEERERQQLQLAYRKLNNELRRL